ncbi:nucleotide-binding universal stress UspA family protein [Rhodovulum imhoffii]|uniref:Nucleotide-binding universal stress UspA family protein n=1 Tax=Rhodovulum imhoffii TaxID=365340 RepID=A0A2T5BQW4_9RHOB|nr:universal stress protein [Rhodovulum imhoffii]MBK5932584.1 universal stress protein [Rhodovulum imhoffii]PTN01633.1 nucleotide-binding universal stress UspA family protein [Rhodovulum imhoffii]
MSTSILCAIDVNQLDADREVLRTAIKLARVDEARLDVITVVPDFGMSVVGGYFDKGFHDKAMAKARKMLNDFVKSEIGADANSGVRHIIATGKAYEEILHAAHEAGSDLIVIGSHKPDLRDYLLGPNAARVVRHSDCSVYVVR